MKTWPYQPDVELPEPFGAQEFTIEDATDISPESRQYILDRFAEDGATMGWMLPNALNRPNVIPNINGGAEWTGACTDPNSGMLYLNSNQYPWYITLTQREEDFVDETKLEPTPGRKLYEVTCIVCHGPNREGTGEFPALLHLNRRMNDAQVIEMLKTGSNVMPPAPQYSRAGSERFTRLPHGPRSSTAGQAKLGGSRATLLQIPWIQTDCSIKTAIMEANHLGAC